MSATQINGATQIRAGSIPAAAVDASLITADGTHPYTADQDMAGHRVTGLGAPGSAGDAATKAYVDAAVVGLMDLKGSTDASGNPNYPAALKGDAYVVSVAGKIGGAAGVPVDVGDVYVASADNAGGDQATVGASWFVLEHSATAPSWVNRETPAGTVNGSNVTFTLANTPVSGTEMVFVNGILMDAGAGQDYTIAAAVITFLAGAIPQAGDKVRVSYYR